MNKKIAILLWATTPEQPASCTMPFVYAAVAAAMDCEVEVHFTGLSVRLLVDGVAAGITSEQTGKTVYDLMQEASEQGVRFLACSMALKDYVAAEEAKVPEYSGAAGAASFIMRNLDPDWRVMLF